jgi:hypothetical protein
LYKFNYPLLHILPGSQGKAEANYKGKKCAAKKKMYGLFGAIWMILAVASIRKTMSS